MVRMYWCRNWRERGILVANRSNCSTKPLRCHCYPARSLPLPLRSIALAPEARKSGVERFGGIAASTAGPCPGWIRARKCPRRTSRAGRRRRALLLPACWSAASSSIAMIRGRPCSSVEGDGGEGGRPRAERWRRRRGGKEGSRKLAALAHVQAKGASLYRGGCARSYPV